MSESSFRSPGASDLELDLAKCRELNKQHELDKQEYLRKIDNLEKLVMTLREDSMTKAQMIERFRSHQRKAAFVLLRSVYPFLQWAGRLRKMTGL